MAADRRQPVLWLALGACLACAIAPTGPAEGQERAPWDTSGNWEISVDDSTAAGCYAVAEWADGTVLRIGQDRGGQATYLILGNANWSAVANQGYDLSLRFGRWGPFDIRAQAIEFTPGGPTYLFAETDTPELVEGFRRANTMSISFGGDRVGQVRLTGSSRAWRTIETCRAAARPTSD